MNDGDGSDRNHDGVDGRAGTDGDGGADVDDRSGTDGDIGTDVDGRSEANGDGGADVDDGPGTPPAPGDADDGREWEFSLEDIQQRQADAAREAEAAERRRQPLEPGDPSLEGVVFVLLGVVLTLFILSRLVVG